MAEEVVSLELTKPQDLVLFEWLARTSSSDVLMTTFEHLAERDVLWALEGKLESALVEPLTPDYLKLLAQARREIHGGE
jgi:hypothetical protein